ncbi:hypothetical protein Leryth_012681 [Lithospermum erythrorhizon]|nr:hypothetical protein Leryth_012681 [Lithospermum erythrorhizon]
MAHSQLPAIHYDNWFNTTRVDSYCKHKNVNKYHFLEVRF